MWKDYSKSYIKNNRASSIAVIAAAFIAALFLSFLCSLFYGIWMYDVEKVIREEGDWQGRITGNISKADLDSIRNFGNVKLAAVNPGLSGEGGNQDQEVVVDVYFENVRTIFQDMPLIAQRLGLEEGAVSYHVLLLSQYLVHDPQDETPPLLLSFYLSILIMVCFSLVLIIRNSFGMAMNARIHQLGIFSSVGATPAQIRACLIQEAAVLSVGPILLGTLLGIAASFGVEQAMNLIGKDIPGRHEILFYYHPLVFVVTVFSAFLTVLCSAWLPARKLSRMTPLEAIRNTGDLTLKKKKRSRALSLLFGIEGELAGNSLKARRRVMATSTLSLTLSFLGFTLVMCFFTLSGISTRYTYFERYQDAWDVMVTVRGTDIGEFVPASELSDLKGVKDLVVYQKAEAVTQVSEPMQSEELAALGGLEALAGKPPAADGGWLVEAPVVVMDDAGFTKYCNQIGAAPRLDGTIVLNRIWDSLNSVFRYPRYIPYIGEDRGTVILQNAADGEKQAEVPVTAYTTQPPVLREEYGDYALVQFVPVSLWREISKTVAGAEPELYVRILGEEGAGLNEMGALEKEALLLLGRQYEAEGENRIQEKKTNDDMILGFELVLGGLCCVLAMIGIANVFSNTLGFLRQRKREFARYLSVGMTPAGIRRQFWIEALVVAGRPVLVTAPLAVVMTGYMLKASYLDPAEFLAEAPVVPILAFAIAIFGFVGLAYYLGGKKVMGCSLSEALRDDTLE